MKKIDSNREYIIVEVIPTNIDPSKGELVQISALKLKGLVLIDRFDYRLDFNKILIPDLIRILDYDHDKFRYVDSSRKLLDEFKKWANDLDLLIIDNVYTKKYLDKLGNKKESILKYLNLEYSDDIIDIIMSKYNIEVSNYITDILYEALIYEINNK